MNAKVRVLEIVPPGAEHPGKELTDRILAALPQGDVNMALSILANTMAQAIEEVTASEDEALQMAERCAAAVEHTIRAHCALGQMRSGRKQ